MHPKDQFVRSLRSLSPVAQRTLFKQFGDPAEIGPGPAMAIWTMDLLAGIDAFGGADCRSRIFEVFGETLQTYGELLAQSIQTGDKKIPVSKLGMADRRYVYCSGFTGFLDLQSGDVLPGIPRPPIEEVYYNLSVLYTNQEAFLAHHPDK